MIPNISYSNSNKSTDKLVFNTSNRSSLNDTIGEITRGIHKTSQILNKLNKLVKSNSLEDLSDEINSLIYRIKQDIEELTTKCDKSQHYLENKRKSISNINLADNLNVNNNINQLKSEINAMTKGFKTILELRSSKIKHQQQKKMELTQLNINNNINNNVNQQPIIETVNKPTSIHISIKPPVPVQNIRPTSANSNKDKDVDNQPNISYKLHYGYGNQNTNYISPKILVNQTPKLQNTTIPLLNTTEIKPTFEIKRPHSASSTRVHRVISDSQKYTPDSVTLPTDIQLNPPVQQPQVYTKVPLTNAVEAKINLPTLGNTDKDIDEESLNDIDKHNLGTEKRDEKEILDRNDNTNDNDYDDEMDGKIFSRSHPEVSTTTPSHSVDLNGLPVNIDIRNSSIDSMTNDDNIDLGLSTLPNQFCNKKDAYELKKLILFSNNNHAGGMVPSSSAVMDMYMVGKVIGVGSYGKVRAAWHRLTSSKVAIKTYDKSKMKDSTHWKRVYSEIKIMEQLSHPRISRLYEAIETPKRMHLIMECLDGGNLCSYVKSKKKLSEEEAKKIFFQVLQAIEYLHSLGVTHRDIKLENVLFTSNSNNNSICSDIKLIDFGFSTVCEPGKRLKVFCGTPSYMAPEIVKRQEYDGKSIDMWSLGILLYALLCGCFPFRAKTYPDLYRRIARGIFTIPEELSAPVKDLLRQLLTIDSNDRLTAVSALRHPWLQIQLSYAIDLNKLRKDIPFLISDKPSDDLDETVLNEIEVYGIPRDDIIRSILNKTHCAITTLYYLLLDNTIIKRKLIKKTNSSSNITIGRVKPIISSSNQNINKPIPIDETNKSTNKPMNVIPAYQPIVGGITNGWEGLMNYNNNIIGTNNNNNNSRPKSASAVRNTAKPLINFLGKR